MKITPVSSPLQVQPAGENAQKAADARARAVAAYTGQAAAQQPPIQETPVPNPSAVAPEDMVGVLTTTPQPQIEAQPVESDNNAETSEATTSQDVRERAKQDPEVQRRFQQLARQERALRAKIQEQNISFKKREAELKAKEEALTKTQTQDLSNFISKDRLQQDALSVLEDAGVSYDDLVAQVASRQNTDPRVMSTIQKLQEKISTLENRLEEGKQEQTKSQQQAYQAAIKQIRFDAKELVQSDDNYTTIRDMNAVKDVVELIDRTYKQNGTVLSVEKACDMVENYLLDEATRIANSKKVRERTLKASATPTKPEMKPQQAQQPQMKTLTNSVSSQRPLTARERALAAFEGKLK